MAEKRHIMASGYVKQCDATTILVISGSSSVLAFSYYPNGIGTIEILAGLELADYL